MAPCYNTSKEAVSELYPEIEPYEAGFLQVSSIHSLYYEQSGNPKGRPVIYLHGGPGGGTSSRDRRFFDPSTYRIVVFDQRGAGKSTPSAELRENTTWDLVEDIERLRKHLKIDRWVVFGGSWGSTLALAYAETHPRTVKGLILRGIFTLRRCGLLNFHSPIPDFVGIELMVAEKAILIGKRRELLWFYQEGASWLFADFWEDFLAPIPEAERGDLMSAYYRRLTGTDEAEKLKCARAWSKWEMATGRLYCDHDLIKKIDEDLFALQFARIECHYFIHGGFFKYDDQILSEVDKVSKLNIPCFVVQGRYDVVCPFKTAWDLYRKWPQVELHVISDAGHSAKEDGICGKLIYAANSFRNL